MNEPNLQLSVSDFVALTNQSLEYAYPTVEVEGEVASYKVNQSKYVFFDIKDAGASVGCFMTVWQLRVPLEDGMKVVVVATPKLTNWGKFSLTVRAVRPVGEGTLKRGFELLKAKLENEGLFDVAKKRPLPLYPERVAVITSTGAAGYADFVKILDNRWGGVTLQIANTQVQGSVASDQMIKALQYFQTSAFAPEVIVMIRGGGSADDLAAYNDEKLARAIASSRIPTLVGVGHEVDVSLADLVADVRASTPSNAAEILVPEKRQYIADLKRSVSLVPKLLDDVIASEKSTIIDMLRASVTKLRRATSDVRDIIDLRVSSLHAYDPGRVLERGYAIVRGEHKVGAKLLIETDCDKLTAEVTDVASK